MVTSLAWGPMALPQLSLELDPGQLLLAALSLMVATMGSVTAAALLVYSPTKLHKRLNAGRRAVIEELQTREGEYQAIARILGVSGAVCGFLLMLEAVQGEPISASLFAVTTLFLCGVLPGGTTCFISTPGILMRIGSGPRFPETRQSASWERVVKLAGDSRDR